MLKAARIQISRLFPIQNFVFARLRLLVFSQSFFDYFDLAYFFFVLLFLLRVRI